MSDESVERSIGRLEGKLQELTQTVERDRASAKDAQAILMEKFEEISVTIAEIRQAQDRVKGGWAMLTVLGSVAAVVGGAISWVLGHVTVN